MYINWNYPEPRCGWRGAWDKFIGPGKLTQGELWLFWLSTFGSGAALVIIAFFASYSWSWWQYLLAFVLAADLGGGCVALSLGVAKRWYHRKDQKHPKMGSFLFNAGHLHPFLIIGLFTPFTGWINAFLVYGYMLLASFTILNCQDYLQRPLAYFLLVLGFIFGMDCCTMPQGFAWFLPVYLSKLIICHLVVEAPFRPDEIIKTERE